MTYITFELPDHVLKASDLVLGFSNLLVEIKDFFLVEGCLGWIGQQRFFAVKCLLSHSTVKLGFALR